MVIYMKRLEPHIPRNALCHVWFKLIYWFWRSFFFVQISKKCVFFDLDNPKSILHKDFFDKLDKWFWRKNDRNVGQQTDKRKTDNRRSLKHTCFQFRRAKTFGEIKQILSSNKTLNTSIQLCSFVLEMLNLTLFKKQQLFFLIKNAIYQTPVIPVIFNLYRTCASQIITSKIILMSEV